MTTFHNETWVTSVFPTYPYGTPYNPYTGPPITRGPFTLAAKAAQTICQTDGTNGMSIDGRGSGKVWTTQGSVVVAANQSSATQVMSYTGVTGPSNTVILPYLVKGYSGEVGVWNSGIAVQNTASETSSITVWFFDTAGNPVGTPYTWAAIESGESDGLYLPNKSDLPDNFIGTAVLTSPHPFAALGNASCSVSCSGDSNLTYNGVNR